VSEREREREQERDLSMDTCGNTHTDIHVHFIKQQGRLMGANWRRVEYRAVPANDEVENEWKRVFPRKMANVLKMFATNPIR